MVEMDISRWARSCVVSEKEKSNKSLQPIPVRGAKSPEGLNTSTTDGHPCVGSVTVAATPSAGKRVGVSAVRRWSHFWQVARSAKIQRGPRSLRRVAGFSLFRIATRF